MLCAVCHVLYAVYYMLYAVCCNATPYAVYCMHHAACCMLCAICCILAHRHRRRRQLSPSRPCPRKSTRLHQTQLLAASRSEVLRNTARDGWQTPPTLQTGVNRTCLCSHAACVLHAACSVLRVACCSCRVLWTVCCMTLAVAGKCRRLLRTGVWTRVWMCVWRCI